MAYATESDFTTLYGDDFLVEIADRDGDDSADTSAVTASLAYAQSFIDSYVGKRYPLPLATVPDSLKEANLVVAAYRLASRGRGHMTEQIDKDWERAVEWLKELAAGDASLGLAEDPASNFLPTITSDPREFRTDQSEGLV